MSETRSVTLPQYLPGATDVLLGGTPADVARVIDETVWGVGCADGGTIDGGELREIVASVRAYLADAGVSAARLEFFVGAILMGCDLPARVYEAFPEDEDEPI
jgi:hypothetical protein